MDTATSRPPLDASWAAMGISLGTSSSLEEDATIRARLNGLKHRTILLIGDSSLRNQFMQLARVGLDFARDMPFAAAATKRAHTGSLSLPYPIRQPDRPDSSNGFWGGFPWLAFSTDANTTIVYVKNWGCADLAATVERMRVVVGRHQHSNGGFGGWPPDSVLWNFGLHLLHVYPARPVPLTSVQCALGYGTLVDQSARTLRAALPYTRLTYRTTNAVCDARFEGAWAAAARAYHCAASAHGPSSVSCKDERAARIHAACQRRYNLTLAECIATFMDVANTRAQRATALSAIGPKHPHFPIGVLDAFELTASRCDATVDGRHYPRILATINAAFLDELKQPVVGFAAGHWEWRHRQGGYNLLA